MVFCLQISAQTPSGAAPDWRRIGNTVVDLTLASPASGPVDRVWYSADGSRLYAETSSGRVFETADFAKWTPSTATVQVVEPSATVSVPAGALAARLSGTDSSRLYAYGDNVFRSDDGGRTWGNVTAFEKRSIIGSGMRDLAVSPRDSDDVVVANDDGVWRSLDGGNSWTGLNDSLPNLPFARIWSLPRGAAGLRLITTAAAGVMEWAPGEKLAWKPVDDPAVLLDQAAKKAFSAVLAARITAVSSSGDFVYAGSADGRLWTSLDKGKSWTASAMPAESGSVTAIFADARDPRLALAAFGRTAGVRVMRTINAGQSWDDLTADLPDGAAYGITADRSSGTVYVATARGVFLTHGELNGAGAATPWIPVSGLPAAKALDVRLDEGGNQLFVALEGYGVYAAMAPHRAGSFRLVNAADFSQRPAAPGSLLSVLGGRVTSVRSGNLTFPVLATSDSETQIQVPFTARGPVLSLALETGRGRYDVSVPVANVSPAIFVDRDGTPLLLNADSGVLLDAMNPAHSHSRVQILATGLGTVKPEWPAGVAGPLENAPQVVTAVRAYVDRSPVEVTRAVLAPGYIGLYLLEIQLPALVNAGPAELYVESEGRTSNRVAVWLEP